MIQVHRLQLNANVSGVAFATKSQVPKAMQLKPKKPFAFLLPSSEKLKFDDLGLHVSSPIELVVRDTTTGAIYKRQACIVTSDTTIQYKLPSPQYSATVTVLKEIVLEAHKSSLTKDAFNAFCERPHDMFRQKLREQYSQHVVEGLQLYGFRKVMEQNSKTEVRAFQILTKVSVENRTKLINLSGASDLFARDFLDRTPSQSDLTILPRYWSNDKSGRDQAFRTGASAVGFAGLVNLRKGIAIRGWTCNIKEIRTVVLAQDPRYNSTNMAVVPTIFLESKGWPISLGPADVVAALHHATGLPCVPGRCFRAQGVVTWTVGFTKRPEKSRFTASFNGDTYELLLTEPAPILNMPTTNNRSAKGVGKTSKTSQPVKVEQNEAIVEHERLATLESRMGKMEKRQDIIEDRINDGFTNVQDQLRQLLHCVQPRSSSPQKTGMTPPPKISKTS